MHTNSYKQTTNGGCNKLIPQDRAAHDWFRFVLSFPPHLVREYLMRFGLSAKQRVLDPFCGTGTTLVECKKLGIPSVGVEANSMAYLASKVKVDWDVDARGLLAHANSVGCVAEERLEHQGYIDDAAYDDNLTLFARTRNVVDTKPAQLQTLSPEKLKLLLTNSISPLPLHKTLVLLECLREKCHVPFHDHEQLALAKALVCSISNLHFGPEVGVTTPKKDAAVITPWLNAIEVMAKDLELLKNCMTTKAIVHQGDARAPLGFLEQESIDAVITSPPYPNEKDYTRTTRLESVLLGLINNKQELRSLKKRLVRSNTRGVYKEDNDDQLVKENREIQKIAKAIEKRRIELKKTSGFERMYHRVAKLYFGGMVRHLSELRAFLRPRAQLAYVVGDQASYLRIMIRTGRILAQLAQSLGYELVGIDLFRTRLATATKEQLREEVVILRWPG